MGRKFSYFRIFLFQSFKCQPLPTPLDTQSCVSRHSYFVVIATTSISNKILNILILQHSERLLDIAHTISKIHHIKEIPNSCKYFKYQLNFSCLENKKIILKTQGEKKFTYLSGRRIFDNNMHQGLHVQRCIFSLCLDVKSDSPWELPELQLQHLCNENLESTQMRHFHTH